jgi:Right handed beta helix region
MVDERLPYPELHCADRSHGVSFRPIGLAIALAAGMIAFVAAVARPAAADLIPVTACGQVVSGPATLVGDLDCTGMAGPAVRLLQSASLDLNGFTLSGGDGDGVLCEDRCKVLSALDGGTISGFAGDGVRGIVAAKPYVSVTVSRTAVRDNAGYGVRIEAAPDGAVNIRKSEIRDNLAGGVSSVDRLTIAASTISGNQGDGAAGGHVQVRDSLVELNGTGVRASEFLKIDTCDIVDNVGDGIDAAHAFKSQRMTNQRNGGTGLVLDSIDGPAKVFFSEVSDNGLDGVTVTGPQSNKLLFRFAFIRRNARYGISARDFRLSVSRVDDNAFDGLHAEPGGDCVLRIDRFSTVGNGTDPSCGVSVACADIASCSPPVKLTPETMCDRSHDTSSGFPGTSWSICDDD